VTGGPHLPVERAAAPFAAIGAGDVSDIRAAGKTGPIGNAASNENAPRFVGLQRQLVCRTSRRQGFRRGLEGQAGGALDLVQSHVPEHDAVVALQLGE